MVLKHERSWPKFTYSNMLFILELICSRINYMESKIIGNV